VDQGALVCLVRFRSDQPVNLQLFAPSGRLVGERFGRVAEGQTIAVVGFELEMPGPERAGVWRAVAEMPGQTIEREIRMPR
ncbi:MAG: hypothetical protein JXA74_00225, partial [Anaerolineae bacterium]|nr:hypothetical protein [Anaerolineae bacterium]